MRVSPHRVLVAAAGDLTGRHALLGRIRRETVLRLGHADRELGEALARVQRHLLHGSRQKLNVRGTINVLRNLADLVLDRQVQVVQEREMRWLVARRDDGVGEIDRAEACTGALPRRTADALPERSVAHVPGSLFARAPTMTYRPWPSART